MVRTELCGPGRSPRQSQEEPAGGSHIPHSHGQSLLLPQRLGSGGRGLALAPAHPLSPAPRPGGPSSPRTWTPAGPSQVRSWLDLQPTARVPMPPHPSFPKDGLCLRWPLLDSEGHLNYLEFICPASIISPFYVPGTGCWGWVPS